MNKIMNDVNELSESDIEEIRNFLHRWILHNIFIAPDDSLVKDVIKKIDLSDSVIKWVLLDSGKKVEMQHTHNTYVEGCYRCDLSREEEAEAVKDLWAKIEQLQAAGDALAFAYRKLGGLDVFHDKELTNWEACRE